MANRPGWLGPVAFAAVFCIFAGHVSCSGFGSFEPVPGRTRALDRACRTGGCTLTGSAAFVSGPTADTLGIRMGPSPSSATIVLSDVSTPSGYDWHVEILVSGTGSFTASELGCPSADGSAVTIEPSEDYAWFRMSNCGSHAAMIGSTTVTVAGTSLGTMDIADIRTVGVPGGCE